MSLNLLAKLVVAGAVAIGGTGSALAHHGGKHGVVLQGKGGVSVSYRRYGHGRFRGHPRRFRHGGFHRGFHKPFYGYRAGYRRGFRHGFRRRPVFGPNIVIQAPIKPYYGAYAPVRRAGIAGQPVVVAPGRAPGVFDEGLLGVIVRVTPVYTVSPGGGSVPIGFDQTVQFPDGRTATVRSGPNDPAFQIGESARLIEGERGPFLRPE